jgi:hypothetical protein
LIRTNPRLHSLLADIPRGSVSPEMVQESTTWGVSWLDEIGAKIPPVALPILCGAGGGLSTLYGGYLTYLGIAEMREARRCQDRSGVAIGMANTGIGATFTGMGVMMLGSGAAETWAVVRPAMAATAQFIAKLFALIMSWLGAVLYTFYVIQALCSLPELSVFSKGLHKVLNKAETLDQNKEAQSLQFLQAQVQLNDREKEELTPQVQAQKQRTKLNQFVRRVGNACADNVVRALNKGNLTSREIEDLMAQAHRGNFKQKAVQISLLVAGILGLLGTGLLLAGIGGWMHYALFASASVLYWLNDPIGNVAYKVLSRPPTFPHRQPQLRPANSVSVA